MDFYGTVLYPVYVDLRFVNKVQNLPVALVTDPEINDITTRIPSALTKNRYEISPVFPALSKGVNGLLFGLEH